MNTKYCVGCDSVKTVNQFYFHRDTGKPEKYCKSCKIKKQNTYKKHKVKVSGVPHEQEIIEKLKSIGIYACSGKKSRSRWVDIVAFGCIAIEAKLGKKKNNGYFFTFTSKQVEDGIRGDVIIFMIENDNQTLFYILRTDNPILYDNNHNLKRYLSFTPNREHGNVDKFVVDKMNQGLDNWGLILKVLQDKVEKMKLGFEIDLWSE